MTRHYLNHAATSPMSAATVEAMHQFMLQEQRLGAHVAVRGLSPQAAGRAYELIAAAIGAASTDIALTQSCSDGWSRIVGAMRWQRGDRVLVGRNEWGGNLGMLQHLAAVHGIQVEMIPADAEGAVDLDALEAQLKQPARLVALTLASCNSPLVQPGPAVGALCARAGVPLLVDAAQAFGQLPLDVGALQCAALTAPGRKWLRAPRGTGFAYVNPAFLPELAPPFADHFSRPWSEPGTWAYRPDARRLETSDFSMALRLGLANALEEWTATGVAAIRQGIQQRAEWLRLQAAEEAGLTVQVLKQHAMSGIVTLESRRHPAPVLVQALQAQGIEATASPQAYTPWDMQARGLKEVLRLSVAHDTDWHSLQACVAVLRACERGDNAASPPPTA